MPIWIGVEQMTSHEQYRAILCFILFVFCCISVFKELAPIDLGWIAFGFKDVYYCKAKSSSPQLTGK